MESEKIERFVARLPRIRTLRKELDIGEKGSARVQTFNDTLRLFRRNYKGPTGRRGLDLQNWRSEDDREELVRLVDGFLEQHGSRFWPDSRPNIQYSKQRAL